jgi:DNA-binding transcriptional ArsR family regulator
MGTEEDTYNIIFKAMQHPIRRRILRTLSETPSTYTEIQRTLNIDNGLLNYHLDNMKDLITKNGEEKYTLSKFGKATVNLVAGVEEPTNRASSYAVGSQLTVKLMVIVLAAIVLVSSAVVLDFNNKYVDLSERFNDKNLELAQLQYTNTRLEETLRDLNATLISTQKTPLLEDTLQRLLTEEARGNVTRRWMWILDSGDVKSVDIPFSVSGVDIRLVSQEDVTSMVMKSNGTRLYSLDRVSLTDSAHGVVKFSRYDVFSVVGVPSTYGVHEITYYLERRGGDWVIYGSMMGIGDYFRAIPLFKD